MVVKRVGGFTYYSKGTFWFFFWWRGYHFWTDGESPVQDSKKKDLPNSWTKLVEFGLLEFYVCLFHRYFTNQNCPESGGFEATFSIYQEPIHQPSDVPKQSYGCLQPQKTKTTTKQTYIILHLHHQENLRKQQPSFLSPRWVITVV